MSAGRAPSVAVVGGAGHTGRFVLAELRRRGFVPIAIGRDRDKLAKANPGGDIRTAAIEDPAALDRALAGADAVINCAGPFLDTAEPVIGAALRARIPYLDVTAEQESVRNSFARFGDAARDAGIAVVPALGFYGGLADLMASAALADWGMPTHVRVAIALDSWRPTRGTRLTGARNRAPRLRIAGGRLEPLPVPAPGRTWPFPAPFGTQDVVELPFGETILFANRLGVRDMRSYLSAAPLADLRNPATPPPTPVDALGRSGQNFLVELVARNGDGERRAIVRGRDIYAVTAPLVVEGVARLLGDRNGRRGVLAPGALPGAATLLQDLDPGHLSLELG